MRKDVPKALRTKIIWRGNDTPPSLLLPVEKALEAKRQDWERADKQVAKELSDKLHLLAAFRGVDTKSPMWEHKLCLALAADLYPGFRVVEKTAHRPLEWDYERRFRFMLDVERKRRTMPQARSGHVSTALVISALVNECVKAKKGDYLPKGGTAQALKKTLANVHAECLDRAKYPHLALFFGHPNPEWREGFITAAIEAGDYPEKE